MEITNGDFEIFKELYEYSKIAVNQIICMGEDEDNFLCQPCENRENLARTLYDIEKLLERYNGRKN